MEVFLKEGFTYIPDWNGNKEQKPKDQIKINFTFMSGKDLANTVVDGKFNSEAEWMIICESIENLTVNIGKEKIVVDPEGLYNIKSLYALWFECNTAYKLEANISKKKIQIIFWLIAQNYYFKKKKLHKSKHNKPIVIMEKSANGPVFMKWNDIDDYLTDDAYRMYDIWYKYHMGFGLPGGKSWMISLYI